MKGQTARQGRRLERRPRQLTKDRGWVVLLARYQRPKAIRQSGITRLTRILTDAGMRNAPTIAAAAVAAAKARGASLTGGLKARVPTARCIQHGIPEHDRSAASRKSSLGLAGVSVAIADQIVEVILPSRVADPIKECPSADDQCRCGDGHA